MDAAEKGTDHQSKDEELLASLGYKQEFKREFSWLELLGLAFSVIGIVQSAASVLVYSIPYGGPVSMVWGWLVCSIFLATIALSIAELASSAPTSGGIYYWRFHLSSEYYLCWLVGYSNTIGYISALASVEYATSVQILAAVTIGSGGIFVPTTGQIYGLCCALTVFHGLLSSAATKFVARIQVFYLLLNILYVGFFLSVDQYLIKVPRLFFGLVIAIPVVTPPKLRNSAQYVFGHFENLSHWPIGFAFLLSFLAPACVVGGFDSSVHISEEVKNANIAVPRAIVVSTVLGCIFGWAFILLITFNMGTDLVNIFANPIGQPMATILFNSLGKKGTVTIWSFIIVAINMIGMNILVAASRQVFAFSRDGASPLSKWLSKINKRGQTPVNAVIFCAACAMLLGLLSFANSAAIAAVFSMSVVCTYTAYSIPITARHIGGKTFNPGPFNLGKLSPFISLTAVGFMSMMVVIFLFPTDAHPTSKKMNYTVVVFGGVLLLSTIYYFLPYVGGRQWFTGPARTVDSSPQVALKEQHDSSSDDSKDT